MKKDIRELLSSNPDVRVQNICFQAECKLGAEIVSSVFRSLPMSQDDWSSLEAAKQYCADYETFMPPRLDVPSSDWKITFITPTSGRFVSYRHVTDLWSIFFRRNGSREAAMEILEGVCNDTRIVLSDVSLLISGADDDNVINY